MRKHTSYEDNMKDQVQVEKKQQEQFFLSLTAQLILDESLYLYKKNKLQEAIDQSLENGDRELFKKLSKQYNHFMK